MKIHRHFRLHSFPSPSKKSDVPCAKFYTPHLESEKNHSERHMVIEIFHCFPVCCIFLHLLKITSLSMFPAGKKKQLAPNWIKLIKQGARKKRLKRMHSLGGGNTKRKICPAARHEFFLLREKEHKIAPLHHHYASHRPECVLFICFPTWPEYFRQHNFPAWQNHHISLCFVKSNKWNLFCKKQNFYALNN